MFYDSPSLLYYSLWVSLDLVFNNLLGMASDTNELAFFAMIQSDSEEYSMNLQAETQLSYQLKSYYFHIHT